MGINKEMTLKDVLKHYRWGWRRFIAARRYGYHNLRNSPMVFGNAMPKSGSHLLTQILAGLVEIGPFVDPGFPPVNRDERNQPLGENLIVNHIQSMKPGDIRYGYIHSREPYLTILSQPKYATFFVYRDPRDMLISHIFYAKDMHPGHGMHDYYNQRLNSMEERINVAIEGVLEPGFELASVRQRYESYMGWLKKPQILAIKFEDLILRRVEAFESMIKHLEKYETKLNCGISTAVDILIDKIQPYKSGTYRKGVPGEWKEHFSDSNKMLFKKITGNLLQDLGYEKSGDW